MTKTNHDKKKENLRTSHTENLHHIIRKKNSHKREQSTRKTEIL